MNTRDKVEKLTADIDLQQKKIKALQNEALYEQRRLSVMLSELHTAHLERVDELKTQEPTARIR